MDVPGLSPAVLRHLTHTDPDSWSAVTLRQSSTNLIILNEVHSPGRQNNSLAHELSHLILKHDPAQLFVSADGMMMMAHYNPVHEAEADCLSSTLLVPRVALLYCLDEGFADKDLIKYFSVTSDLIRMRRNITGVDKQRSYRRTASF
jgi:Zn-dependent peptidase ImmA (M78 family)